MRGEREGVESERGERGSGEGRGREWRVRGEREGVKSERGEGGSGE